MVCTSSVDYKHWYSHSLELVTYFGMVYFLIFQMKSIVHIISGCNEFFAWDFFSLSLLVQYSDILTVFVSFLLCIVVPNVLKWSLLELYRVWWILEFVESDLGTFTKKINILHLYFFWSIFICHESISQSMPFPGKINFSLVAGV